MDDDLILNVAVASNEKPVAAKSAKGGRWTDRLKVKRSLKRKARPAHSDFDDRPVNTPQAPPAKRPRKEPVSAPSPAKALSRPTQFISSLFTSNPKLESKHTATSQVEVKPAAPSNAPLADASSFSGLGLNPLIIAHLASKMNITKPTSIQKAALPPFLLPSAKQADRDVFIQSQTGSGKTLSFLLPIIQDLLPLGSLSYIDRSIGTLAIIIAPTRELAQQIHDVLEALLKLRLRAEDENAEEGNSRITRWLVSGLLTGGATRTHEKARIRKGLPIVVATPGRLLDHLQNTSTFNVGKCRWLVLDEADRLMDLGFQETITGIIQGLDGRRRLAKQAAEEGKGTEVGGWDWTRRRRAVLCSATIQEDVQKLAGVALTRPLMIKATEADKSITSTTPNGDSTTNSDAKFTPPSQLSQKYVVVPLKLRLVALVALLRSLLSKSANRRGGSKVIVFLSCTDSVDFHWKLLGGTSMKDGEEASVGSDDSDEEASEDEDKKRIEDQVSVQSPFLPNASIYRLHGSLPTPVRLASLRGFAGSKKTSSPSDSSSSILLCTSVASRGLDLPLVRAVIQYDLPTEGGATEYVHRVGRTARAGKGGEAWSIVAPSESEWAKWVVTKMRGETQAETVTKTKEVKGSESDKQDISLKAISVENVLRDGFGGQDMEYEDRATEVQLAFERWVLRRKDALELARKAYLSHMRAYSTHPANEKHIFHIRHLHLGHLAKSFALRDAPKSVTNAEKKGKSKTSSTSSKHHASSAKRTKTQNGNSRRSEKEVDEKWEAEHNGEAEKRMQNAVRAQGRLMKQKGVMMSSGTSEFQIAGGMDLEKLVNGR